MLRSLMLAGCLLAPAVLAVDAGASVISVPGDAPTIQAAIDGAVAGDEIVVAPGVYRETIDLLGKAITLRSAEGADRTVIDGSDRHDSVVMCINGEGVDTVLQGFLVTGGTGSDAVFGDDARVGGGMLVIRSNPSVVDCIFRANAATFLGGGFYSGSGSFVNILDCIFEDNAAEKGGAFYSMNSMAVIQRTTFVENVAGYGGGALYIDNRSDVQVLDCTFSKNLAMYNGGALYAYDCRPVVLDCTFTRNAAIFKGGAVYHGYRSDTQLARCEFLTPNDDIAGTSGFRLSSLRPRGACCIGDSCVVIERELCLGAGGLYVGDDTGCDQVAALCPAPLVGDVNDDGAVDVVDLFLLMGSWGRSDLDDRQSSLNP